MSDFLANSSQPRRGRRVPVLHVVMHASDPAHAPSRHLLDGVEIVHFGRGDRRASRDRHDGLRRLAIRVADPVMSTDHGRLLFAHGSWLLEDPRSKNGSVVAGRPTRAATVCPGDVFVLGHTLFLLDETEIVDGEADRFADEPAPPVAALATLDDRFQAQIDLLARVAPSDVPVLLLGETGTGKEVFARALHAMSGRRGAFVPVNCGGLAAGVVESELFGHRRGAFSGAVSDRPGYLRSSDGGTLFLDEIGELPLSAQAALLRVLQQREVTPVGDVVPEKVDLHVCAATHRDLAEMVAEGTFREDLYARLLGVTVTLPPLRDRRCDLGLLVRALLRDRPGGSKARFTLDAAHALLSHRWPMNVRELERTLAAALVLAGRDPIDVGHLPEAVVAPSADAPAELDRNGVDAVLRTHQGNLSRAAADLRTSRSQLRRLMARFGLAVDGYRAR
jgi:DNA-binding NtrC family response regulator